MDIFNLGLEDLNIDPESPEAIELTERLQVLNERVDDIERTGLITRDQARLLVEDSQIPLNTSRYPVSSFTADPSRTNLQPALESAEEKRVSVMQVLIQGAIEAYKRVRDWLLGLMQKIKALFKRQGGEKIVANATNAAELDKGLKNAASTMQNAANDAQRSAHAAAAKASQASGEVDEGIQKLAEGVLQATVREYVAADQKLVGERFGHLPILSSRLLTDAGVRHDFIALRTGVPILIQHLYEGQKRAVDKIKTVENRVKTGTDPAELTGEIEKLVEEIRSYTHHPLTTKIYQKYGGEGEADIGKAVALFHHVASEQSGQANEGLTPEVAAAFKEMYPTFSSDMLESHWEKATSTAEMQAATSTMQLMGVGRELRDAVRAVVTVTSDISKIVQHLGQLDVQAVRGLWSVGQAMVARAELFIRYYERMVSAVSMAGPQVKADFVNKNADGLKIAEQMLISVAAHHGIK